MPRFMEIFQVVKKSRERDRTFGDGRFCAQLCIETPVAHLTNFFFALYYAVLTEDASMLLLSRVETNCSLVMSNRSSSNEQIFEYFRIPDREVVANPIVKIPTGQEVKYNIPQLRSQLRSKLKGGFQLEVLFLVLQHSTITE